MSFLSSVSIEPKVSGSIITLAGQNGIGKSSFLERASLAKAIICDLEHGTNHLKVAKIQSIADIKALNLFLQEFLNERHDYTLLGIDTVDVLESLICDSLIKEAGVKSIEQVGGGFGKGYVQSREQMRSIMGVLRAIANKGIDVVLTSHTQVKPHTDPAENTQFDRFVMRCNDKMASIVKDLSDYVFFATYKVYLSQAENGKTRATGMGERVMYTQWRPGFDAKARAELPFEMPLSYDAFKTALLSKYSPSPEELIITIRTMLGAVKDQALIDKVTTSLSTAGTNVEQLIQIKTRLQTLISK